MPGTCERPDWSCFKDFEMYVPDLADIDILKSHERLAQSSDHINHHETESGRDY
jgi:hypothetical protein